MDEMRSPEGNCPDADPSMMTRMGALTAALQARRPPQPDRAYSTLIEASDATDVEHPSDCTCGYQNPFTRVALDERIVSRLQALYDEIQRSPGPIVRD